MATTAGKKVITISPVNEQTVCVHLRGTAPLVIHKFSARIRDKLAEKMKAGSTSAKGQKREARDFEADFRDARHVSEDGWYGVHAAAFRNACIDACRLAGYKMTQAKMSLSVIADGRDRDDGVPLVKIIGGDPEPYTAVVRNDTGVVDIRVRPMWREWGVDLRIRYDADQFTASDVVNLVERAGRQIGVGEGRPFSRNSAGLGFGTFTSVEAPVADLEATTASVGEGKRRVRAGT